MKATLTTALLVLLTASSLTASAATPAEVVAKITKSADTLLETLSDEQKKTALFSFDDEEQRRRWSNLPVTMVERKGLRTGDLSKEQHAAMMQVLKATLSDAGYQQVVDNVNADEYLARGSARARSMFGADEFFFSILGKPSTTEPWMWQFGGHHLAINATIVGDKITLSPSLTGGQPVNYEWEGRQVRQLAAEEDTAFKLINSLSKEQQQEAILGHQKVNLNFGPTAKNIMPKEEGIKASKLDKKQQDLLLELIGERIGILNATHAKVAMKEIKQELPDTWFSWYGPTPDGSPSSWRIQGPSLIMEYMPQDLGGDPTNHTHAMYRDPFNDYGAGFLKAR